MKKIKIVQFVTIGGVLSALTVILQSSPVFLPAIGLALSPFSTIPIAIAAVLNNYLGVAVLLSSTLILIILSPQEALILLFATGLLGVILGIMLYRKGIFISIIVSTVSLTVGMCVLTYLVAVPGFVEITGLFSLPLILLFFFLFSLIYVSVWSIILQKFVKLLIRLKVIVKPVHDINKQV
ncbi:MAG: hypothetical protein K0R46_616 [Herbinix sp.]|nr:hypothetical protein [Herbinix sp.]